MTEKFDTYSTFMWCAAFAATASLFQTLLEIFSEKNDSKKFSRRDAMRTVLSVGSVGFYGGLSGWAIQHLWPDARGELLGIVAAVLGSGGTKAQKLFLGGVVEAITKVKVNDGKSS